MASKTLKSAKPEAAPAAESSDLVAIDPVEKVFLNNVPHVPHLVPADVAEALVATGAFSLADAARSAEIAQEVADRHAAAAADREGASADESEAEPGESAYPEPDQADAPDAPAEPAELLAGADPTE